jgi:hypothetical protein
LNRAKLKSLPCGGHSDGHGLFLSAVERGGAISKAMEFAKIGGYRT